MTDIRPEKTNPETSGKDAGKPQGMVGRLVAKGMSFYDYVMNGIWSDSKHKWWTDLLKTVNLSLRSFFNADLQMRAAALTYQTILAIVPTLALIFAIGRGFGFQNLLQGQLFNYFPAQKQALEQAFKFVDSYLEQASEGLFVGIGIVFLLWTIISLLSSVEDCFNKIWEVKSGRPFMRKLTDYLTICLVLPVLMICASGITVFMSTTVQAAIPFKFATPIFGFLMDLTSLALIWLFFAGAYFLIPNTRVKIKNALIAGVLAGTSFLILQWLFLTGQLYVTKYNAIYGSFAFLPLLLIWLQLVWLITLSGGVVCYSSQNIFQFSFSNEIDKISDQYRWKILVSVYVVIVKRFVTNQTPMTELEIANAYKLPIRLVSVACNRLVDCGLVMRVVTKVEDAYALSPAIDPVDMTLGRAVSIISSHGSDDFIPGFSTEFASVVKSFDGVRDEVVKTGDETLVKDLEISLPVA